MTISMGKLKVNIKGAYGATNFGDDLLMDLFEKYFIEQFENIQINFQGAHDVDYPNKMLLNSTYNAKGFDEGWLVYGGGTQFFSYQSSKRTIRSVVNTIFNKPDRIKDKLLRKLKLKKTEIKEEEKLNYKYTAFLGFGLGPFYDNVHKITQVKKILNESDFIGVRDQVSKNYCEEWDIKASFGADIAFSSYFKYKPTTNLKPSVSKNKKVAIIVRDWVWEETGKGYYSPIVELYKKENKNFDFQFVVFAPFKDPDWMTKLQGEDFLFWDPNKYSIQDFLDILNSFDVFISSRFHGAIIGALLNKPVIAIEIEPKLRILTEDVKEIELWEKPFKIKDIEDKLQALNYDVDYSKSLLELKNRSDLGLKEFSGFFKNLE